MKTHALTALLALACLTPRSEAHDYQRGSLKIDHPWTRASVAAQKTAAGYLTLRNTGRSSERLLGASSPAAARVEMHVTTVKNNVARMRETKSFEVRPGGTLRLAPGGAHLMLVDIARPFKAGERVPLVLRFENAGEVALELAVEAGARPSEPAHKH